MDADALRLDSRTGSAEVDSPSPLPRNWRRRKTLYQVKDLAGNSRSRPNSGVAARSRTSDSSGQGKSDDSPQHDTEEDAVIKEIVAKRNSILLPDPNTLLSEIDEFDKRLVLHSAESANTSEKSSSLALPMGSAGSDDDSSSPSDSSADSERPRRIGKDPAVKSQLNALMNMRNAVNRRITVTAVGDGDNDSPPAVAK